MGGMGNPDIFARGAAGVSLVDFIRRSSAGGEGRIGIPEQDGERYSERISRTKGIFLGYECKEADDEQEKDGTCGCRAADH